MPPVFVEITLVIKIKIDEDLQDENSKLRALISNNFGRRKNDPAKDRKALATYVELKGYKHGEMGNGRKKTCQNGASTLDEIAKELNMSKRNLQRALRIERNLTDSMKELLDTGEITKTFASDTIASLTEEEQEELISKLDVTKKYTQKQIEKYIAEMKSPDSDNQELLEQYNVLKTEKENLESLNESLEEAKKLSDDIANKYKKNSDEYDRLKNDITDMGLNPNGEYLNMTQINSTNTTNKTKTNTHNDNPKDTKTEESYSNFMNNMEYFSVFGFLLSGLANYMIHEQQISD